MCDAFNVRISEGSTYYCLVVQRLPNTVLTFAENGIVFKCLRGPAVSAHLRVLKEANLITKKSEE